jgi:GMP synthase (glutamine-hydrolysing)
MYRRKPVKRAVVLTHEEFEGPARIADAIARVGYEIDLRALHRGNALPFDLERDELLIVMGGPMGVGDLARPEYSFLQREVDLLRQRVEDDAPVLGICLGAQLLAHAAGAAVRPMMTADGRSRLYEVGWGSVRFHGEADDGLLEGIASEAVMLHWHGDTFDLPAGARLFASSGVCRNQGFQLGRRLFGLQFHCEASAEDIEAFLREDAEFVAKAHGEGGVDRVRRETAHHIDEFRDVGDRLLQNIVRAMIET